MALALVAASLSTRLVERFLFEIEPLDIGAWASSVAILTAAAALATIVPRAPDARIRSDHVPPLRVSGPPRVHEADRPARRSYSGPGVVKSLESAMLPCPCCGNIGTLGSPGSKSDAVSSGEQHQAPERREDRFLISAA